MIDKYIISLEYTVKAAIEKMEKELIKAVIIADDEQKVLGLFSNGDMRSFFLRGGALTDNISKAMNCSPKLYRSRQEIQDERKKVTRVLYPIVDNNNRVVEVVDYEQSLTDGKISDALVDVPLVIMAGGKGTRLYPYTKILPKPLIPIGDITITERIIQRFQKYGCKKVIMILNYKSKMVRAYMDDLEKEYEIEYVKEDDYLGTAGGLKLAKEKLHDTFFVSNCDILINTDLECVYKTHKAKGNKITFVCSMKDFVIPYGIVETDHDGFITNMKEKPEFSYLINTGLYMMEPEVLDDIEDGEFIHLPDLAQRYLDKGEKVGVFPISEKSWMDMGQFSEMENMMKSLGIQ